MAEEHRCQAPRLCANNCGFFGCPATQNLCSKCYRDLQLKEQQSSSAKQAFNQTLASSSSSPPSSVIIASSPAAEKLDPVTDVGRKEETVAATTEQAQAEDSASLLLITPSPAVENLDLVTDGVRKEEAVGVTTTEQPKAAVQANPNRCLTCRKRVGLTGFKCRCRMVFCGTHRYPEQHQCSFDFKTMGKEQIAKANPVIKAPKLEKI